MSNKPEVNKETHPSLTFAGRESLGAKKSEKTIASVKPKVMWNGEVLMKWKNLDIKQT